MRPQGCSKHFGLLGSRGWIRSGFDRLSLSRRERCGSMRGSALVENELICFLGAQHVSPAKPKKISLELLRAASKPRKKKRMMMT